MSLRSKILSIAVPLAALSASTAMAQTTGFAEFIAKINNQGVIVRGSGITSIEKVASNVYIATFPRDISTCYTMVSVAGDPGFAVTSPNATDPAKVNISTFTQKGAPERRNFFLLVRCQD